MSTSIFVNLAVTDLDESKAFFQAIGYSLNEQFTDENAACVVISENIYLMILVPSYFSTFTTKPVADSTGSTEAIIALSAESREGVDELVDKALASGASPSNEPQDYGFMYSRSFQDPSGHLFEVLYMDPEHLES